MPEISDQDYSCLASIMPCLMLKAVIEDISFTLFLFSSLISNSHAAATDANYGQMEPQFFVGRPVMLGNM